MWMAKWWTPDTIFVTLVGAVMAVVLSGSLFAHPVASKTGRTTGGSLVPASVLETVRAQQKDCNAVSDDEADMISRSLRSRC